MEQYPRYVFSFKCWNYRWNIYINMYPQHISVVSVLKKCLVHTSYLFVIIGRVHIFLAHTGAARILQEIVIVTLWQSQADSPGLIASSAVLRLDWTRTSRLSKYHAGAKDGSRDGHLLQGGSILVLNHICCGPHLRFYTKSWTAGSKDTWEMYNMKDQMAAKYYVNAIRQFTCSLYVDQHMSLCQCDIQASKWSHCCYNAATHVNIMIIHDSQHNFTWWSSCCSCIWACANIHK
jgi:hypothetical protein